MNHEYDAIVIGGGHNGLVTAFYLAQTGKRVCVLEAHSEVGGAAITEEFHPGFRNSVAAYTVSLLQAKVIEDMQLYEHGLEVVLRKVDNFLPLDNGYMLAGRNGLTEIEIARFSVADAKSYSRYQSDLTDVVDLLRTTLLQAPPNVGGGLSDLTAAIKLAYRSSKMSLVAQRNLLAFFTKSAAEVLDAYFENDTVKALFAFDSIVGNFASPYTPGSAYVLLHHVFGEAAGVREAWGHAIGGMGAITQAMRRACEAQGVVIHTNCPVERLVVADQRVQQIVCQNAVYKANVVASSLHPKRLFEELMDAMQLPDDFRQRIRAYQSHSGTFRMNVALDGLPKFKHAPAGTDYLTSGIIIAPSMPYMHDAWLSADAKGWSDQPIIEMLIPSTLDDTLSPPGQHVASLFCQQFKFDLPDDLCWADCREIVADHIIKTVEAYAPGFSKQIVAKQILSPLDLQTRLGLIGGDIFHGRMSLDQLFSARPVLGSGAYRTPISNLFMCGSGTHPGGGVTGAPGHNAANVIVKSRLM